MAAPLFDSAFGEVDKLVESIPGGVLRLGEFIVARIRDRTRAGKDKHGKPFEPYGERHIRHRKRFSKQASPVDLTLTGTMLESLSVLDGEGIGFAPSGRGSRFRSLGSGQFTTPEVSIGFSDPFSETLAGIHTTGIYGRGPTKPRPFMCVTDLEIQEGMRSFADGLYKPQSKSQTLVIRFGV